MLLSRLLTPFVLIALVAPVRADVFTVDNSGAPADFSDLQTAVDAAAEGDILLVKRNLGAGYGALVIDGKSLVLHADGNLGTAQLGPTVIRNVGPGQSVVVRGVRFGINLFDDDTAPTLHVLDCAGQVSLDSVVVFGRITDGLSIEPNPAMPALRVEGSSRVALTDGFLRGGPGGIGPEVVMQPGAPAIEVVSGTLSVDGCQLEGGSGASPVGGLTTPKDNAPAGTGGPGLLVSSGTVWWLGGSSRGGSGGAGFEYPGFCQPGGDGGDAVHLTGADALVWNRQVQLVAGPGGIGGGGQLGTPCASNGQDGVTIQIDAGGIQSLTSPPSTYTAPSPLRESEIGTHGFTGEPGDLILLWVSLSPSFLPLPGREGVFHAGFPTLYDAGFAFGVIGPTGLTELDLAAPPEISPGLDGVALHLQTAVGPTGGVKIGGWSTQLLLDASF